MVGLSSLVVSLMVGPFCFAWADHLIEQPKRAVVHLRAVVAGIADGALAPGYAVPIICSHEPQILTCLSLTNF